MTRPARPVVTPLSAARRVCGLPGCRNAVVPPQEYCTGKHKAAANRLKGVATLELYAALHRLGQGVTTGQARTIVRKVGLGVVTAFLAAVGVMWDVNAKEWR